MSAVPRHGATLTLASMNEVKIMVLLTFVLLTNKPQQTTVALIKTLATIRINERARVKPIKALPENYYLKVYALLFLVGSKYSEVGVGQSRQCSRIVSHVCETRHACLFRTRSLCLCPRLTLRVALSLLFWLCLIVV